MGATVNAEVSSGTTVNVSVNDGVSVNASLGSVGKEVFKSQEFTGDGQTTDFTLNFTPRTKSLLCFLQGILQKDGGTDFTLTGKVISFNTAPKSQRKIFCYYVVS